MREDLDTEQIAQKNGGQEEQGTMSLSDIGLFINDGELRSTIDKGYEHSRSAEALRSIRLRYDQREKNGQQRANLLVDRGHQINSLHLRLVVCDTESREEVGTAVIKFVREAPQTGEEQDKLGTIDPATGREKTPKEIATDILKPEQRLFNLKNKQGQPVSLVEGRKYWACFKLDFVGKKTMGSSRDNWDSPQKQYISSIISLRDGFFVKGSLQEDSEAYVSDDQVIDIPYATKWHLITAKRLNENGGEGYKLAFKNGTTVNLAPLGSILMVNIKNKMDHKWVWLRGLELKGIDMLAEIENNVPQTINEEGSIYPKMKILENRLTPHNKVWLDEPFSIRSGKKWSYITNGVLDPTTGVRNERGYNYGVLVEDEAVTRDPSKKRASMLLWVPAVHINQDDAGIAEAELSILYGKYGPWKHRLKLNFSRMPINEKAYPFLSDQESPSGRCFYVDVAFNPQDEQLIERQLLPIDMIGHHNVLSTRGEGWYIDETSRNGDYSGIAAANVSDVTSYTGASISYVNNRRGILNSGNGHWPNMHLPDLRDILSIMPISFMKPDGDIGIGDYGYNNAQEASIPTIDVLNIDNTWKNWASVAPFKSSWWYTLYPKYRMFYNNIGIKYRFCREPVRMPYFQYRGSLVTYPIPGTDAPSRVDASNTSSSSSNRVDPDAALYEAEMKKYSPADFDDSKLKDASGRYVRTKFMEKIVRSIYGQLRRRSTVGDNYVGDAEGATLYGQRFLGTEWLSIWKYVLPYGLKEDVSSMEVNVLYVGNEMDDEWYYRAKHPHYGGLGATPQPYGDGWTIDDKKAPYRKTYFKINSIIGDPEQFLNGNKDVGATAEKYFDVYFADVEDNPYNLCEIVQRRIQVSIDPLIVHAVNATERDAWAYPYLIRQGGFESNNTSSYYLWTVNPTYSHRQAKDQGAYILDGAYNVATWAGLVQLRQFPNPQVKREKVKGQVLPFFNLPASILEYDIKH